MGNQDIAAARICCYYAYFCFKFLIRTVCYIGYGNNLIITYTSPSRLFICLKPLPTKRDTSIFKATRNVEKGVGCHD
jgi:hypothetical protein